MNAPAESSRVQLFWSTRAYIAQSKGAEFVVELLGGSWWVRGIVQFADGDYCSVSDLVDRGWGAFGSAERAMHAVTQAVERMPDLRPVIALLGAFARRRSSDA